MLIDRFDGTKQQQDFATIWETRVSQSSSAVIVNIISPNKSFPNPILTSQIL